jgi:hypothetical protein
MQLELILSSATVVVTIYSLVAGIFGMNIPYDWNIGHPDAFTWVRIKFSHVYKCTFKKEFGYHDCNCQFGAYLRLQFARYSCYQCTHLFITY